MPDPWQRGRIVFTGDVGHSSTPHLPQGPTMAVEDIVVLANEIGNGVDVAGAPHASMNRRFERYKLVGFILIRFGDWEMPTNSASDLEDVTEPI